ncbi:hypothetical protein KIL84_001581, partial [Mauremys mutica]
MAPSTKKVTLRGRAGERVPPFLPGKSESVFGQGHQQQEGSHLRPLTQQETPVLLLVNSCLCHHSRHSACFGHPTKKETHSPATLGTGALASATSREGKWQMTAGKRETGSKEP